MLKKLFLVIPIILVMLFLILTDNNISGNGRKYCLTFAEGLTLQLPPPKSKLINFMNKKYGIKFRQYKGDMFSEGGFRYSHYKEEYFDKYYNGIIVSTDDCPEHYFYVCDYYGTIHDDYGCHLAESDAEQILEKELVKVIDTDFKVILHPNFFQENIFSEKPSGMDYLENGKYIIKIFISGNSDACEEQLKKISAAVAPYWSRDCFMYIYWVNDDILNGISAKDYATYSDFIDYNKMGQGWGLTESGTIHSWEWFDKQ